MTANIDSIATRLVRLQRAVTLLALMVVSTVAWLLLATPAHQKLRTEALELVTPNGDIVAHLESKDGYPVFVLQDESGVERVRLFHDTEGSGLYISDESATTRIGIAQFAHGGGGVALHGADSKGALVMYFKNNGSLRFFNHEGEVIREIHAADLRKLP